MKKYIIMALLAVLVIIPQYSDAAYIDLQSSLCETYGNIGLEGPQESWLSFDWDLSDETSAIYTIPELGWTPGLATVDISGSTASLRTLAYQNDTGTINSHATMVFQPIGAYAIDISPTSKIGGGGEACSVLELFDLTTSTKLLKLMIYYHLWFLNDDLIMSNDAVFDYDDPRIKDGLQIAVDSSHTYKLVNWSCGADDPTDLSVTINLVPEPTTMLLLGLGLIGLAGMGRKFKS